MADEYLNGDSGYLWLTCGIDGCEESIHCLDAGDLLAGLVTAARAHDREKHPERVEIGGGR